MEVQFSLQNLGIWPNIPCFQPKPEVQAGEFI
jgi:hypothetical protein